MKPPLSVDNSTHLITNFLLELGSGSWEIIFITVMYDLAKNCFLEERRGDSQVCLWSAFVPFIHSLYQCQAKQHFDVGEP